MLTWIREKFGKAIIGGIVTLIALVFVFYGVFNPRATRGLHEGAVAGTVNGDAISISEFNRAYTRQVEFFKNMLGGGKISDEQLKSFHIKESVFQELVRRKIMIQEAEKQGNIPSDEEIRDKVREIPAFQKDGKFDLTAYKQTLEANSYTPASFEQMLRDDLAVQRWENYFKNRVNVSDDEVKIQFLTSGDKRNIKYVLLTSEVGKKMVKTTPEEVKKFMDDPTKMNLAKSRYESQKQSVYKGKPFDAVKEEIARDLVTTAKYDEVKKANNEIANKVLALFSANKTSDAAVNKLLKPYGVEVKQTGLVSHASPYLPGIGEAKDLLADAFSDKNPIDPAHGGKVKRYDSTNWVLIAVVSDSQKADLSKLPEQRASVMREITAKKERELFDAWMKKVEEKAKIDPNPSVINGSDQENAG